MGADGRPYFNIGRHAWRSGGCLIRHLAPEACQHSARKLNRSKGVDFGSGHGIVEAGKNTTGEQGALRANVDRSTGCIPCSEQKAVLPRS